MRQRVVLPVVVLGFVGFALGGASHSASAQSCVRNDFAYGAGGYAAGYTYEVNRRIWGGCGPRLPLPCAPRYRCGPVVPSCWRPCLPRPCWYGPGPWCWGGYGVSSFAQATSVFLAVPPGGGATFFSGGLVPYPVPYAVPYAVPYVVPWPWFGAGGVAPVGLVARQPAPVPRPGAPAAGIDAAAVADVVSVAARVTTAAARQRAARLVAKGDRQVREAAGDATRLRGALADYRRAARMAHDDPDVLLRQALVHEALGERALADRATAAAIALDRRLDDDAPAPAGAAADAVFGDRVPGAPSPLAARGAALLRAIAGNGDAGGADGIDRIARRWAARFGGPEVAAVNPQ